QRDLIEADEVYLLQHAVVADFEIRRPEATDRTVPVRDEDVDAYRIDATREHRLLTMNRSSARSEQRQRDDERHATRHRPGPRNGAYICSSRSPARRPCSVV